MKINTFNITHFRTDNSFLLLPVNVVDVGYFNAYLSILSTFSCPLQQIEQQRQAIGTRDKY